MFTVVKNSNTQNASAALCLHNGCMLIVMGMLGHISLSSSRCRLVLNGCNDTGRVDLAGFGFNAALNRISVNFRLA